MEHQHLRPVRSAWEKLADRHLLTRHFRHVGKLTLLVLAAGLFWRIARYALQFPLWGDEGFVAMNFVLRDYAGLFRLPLEYHQIIAPLFSFGQLAIVRLLGYGEWALRLLPFVSGVVVLVLFWRFARQVASKHAVLLAVGFLAAAYYPVRHGAEVKPYTIDLLVSMVLLWLGWAVSKSPGSIARWVALILTGAAAGWVSLPASFVTSGVGIYLTVLLLRQRAYRRLVPLAAFGLVAAASFLAMYFTYARPMAAASQWYWTIPTWQDGWPPIMKPWLLPWWLIATHAGRMFSYPAGGKNFGSAATFIAVLAGCVFLYRRGGRGLLGLLLCPFVTTFIAACFKRYPYGCSARTSMYLAPAICLLAGVGLSAIIQALSPRRLVGEIHRIAAFVMILIALVGATADIIQPYKSIANPNVRAGVRDLADRTSPGDGWVMINSPERNSPAVFLRGKDAVTFRFYVSAYVKAPITWGPPLDEIPAPQGRTWLIYYTDPENPDRQQRDAKRDTYVRAVSQQLGEPRCWSYSLVWRRPGFESPAIEVYLFGPANRATQPAS